MAVPRQWLHNYSYAPSKPSVAQQNAGSDPDDPGDQNTMSSLKQMLATKPGKKAGVNSPLSVSLSAKRKKGNKL